MVLHPLYLDDRPDPSITGSGGGDAVSVWNNEGPHPESPSVAGRYYQDPRVNPNLVPQSNPGLRSLLIGPSNPMTPHVFEEPLAQDTRFYLPNGTQIIFKGGTTLLRRRSDASLYMGVLAGDTKLGGWIYKAGTPIRLDSGDEPEAGILAEGNTLEGMPVPEGTKIIVMEGKGDPLFAKTGRQAVKQLHLSPFASLFIHGRQYNGIIVFDPHKRMPTHSCDNFKPVDASDPLAPLPVGEDNCVEGDLLPNPLYYSFGMFNELKFDPPTDTEPPGIRIDLGEWFSRIKKW